jgi:hypothetical protein
MYETTINYIIDHWAICSLDKKQQQKKTEDTR